VWWYLGISGGSNHKSTGKSSSRYAALEFWHRVVPLDSCPALTQVCELALLDILPREPQARRYFGVGVLETLMVNCLEIMADAGPLRPCAIRSSGTHCVIQPVRKRRCALWQPRGPEKVATCNAFFATTCRYGEGLPHTPQLVLGGVVR